MKQNTIIEHRTSNIEHRTSNIELRTRKKAFCDMRLHSPAVSVRARLSLRVLGFLSKCVRDEASVAIPPCMCPPEPVTKYSRDRPCGRNFWNNKDAIRVPGR